MATFIEQLRKAGINPWQSTVEKTVKPVSKPTLTKPKFNLFDGINKSIQTPKPKQLNFAPQSTSWATFQAPTTPTPAKPTFSNWVVPQANAETTQTPQPNIIQEFLTNTKTNPEFTKKRNAVIEMLKNWEDETWISDVIVKNMWYKSPQKEQWFIWWALGWIKDIAVWGIKRIWEAGVWLAEWKYTMPEAFARWWAGALQTTFSPISWILWQWIKTGIENIPQWFKDFISKKATPTIQDVKMWYDSQSPEQRRKLDNIWVWTEILLNFAWLKWAEKWIKASLPALEQAGKQVVKTGWKVLKTWKKLTWWATDIITSPIKQTVATAKTLVWKPDEISWIQQAIRPYLKTKWWKVIRWQEQVINEIKTANNYVKNSWIKQTWLSTYREALEKQLKSVWKQISEKTGQDLSIDLTDTAWKLKQLANSKTVKLLDKAEWNKLKQIADDIAKWWKISVQEAEFMNQWINDVVRSVWTASETYKKWLNLLVQDIRTKLDDTLSLIPWEFKQIKKDYGALRNVLWDTIKREIIYNRANPEWLISSFSKIEWLSNVWSWLLKIAWLDVKWWVSQIWKWLLQNKVWAFIKGKNDPNYIIQQIFSKNNAWNLQKINKSDIIKPLKINQLKNDSIINTNIPSSSKSNLWTTKNLWGNKKIVPTTINKPTTLKQKTSNISENDIKTFIDNKIKYYNKEWFWPAQIKDNIWVDIQDKYGFNNDNLRKYTNIRTKELYNTDKIPQWKYDLNFVEKSTLKQKTWEQLDKIATKVWAKKNLLEDRGTGMSGKVDDLIENVWDYTEWFKKWKLFDISPQSKSKISSMEIKADMWKIKPEEINNLNKWFRENKENYIKLYHWTSPEWKILDEWLRATSNKTAKSLQSWRWYVYLSFDPSRAKTFWEMAYAWKIPKVYEVKVKIWDLLADTDQIWNKRYWWENQNIWNTLADSLLYWKWFKVKGNIQPYKITEYQSTKPTILKPKK